MTRSALLCAVSAVALISSASAADLYGGGGFKDVPVLAPVATWTGFYLGVNGGYGGYSGNNFTTSGTDLPYIHGSSNIGGGFGGGQIGYNWQDGFGFSSLVLGIETDIQGSGISGNGYATLLNTTPSGVSNVSTNVDWFGTVRGRVGYVFDRTLIYGTGGFAYGGINRSFALSDSPVTGRISASNTETGWTAGGGVEFKFYPAWSVKVEYQYIDLGSLSNTGPLTTLAGCNLRGASETQFHTIRVGLNYQVGEPFVPLK